MKITAIKQQIKRQDRYSVYVDEEYVCSFSEGELVKLGLHSDMELTTEELRKLKDDSQSDKAYMRSIDLLSRRARSEWEIRDYLRRKDYDAELIDIIVNRLKVNMLINDIEFASRWVDNRRLLKPTSTKKLRLELRQKRIEDDIVNQVLEADETDERDVLRQLVERKRGRYPDRQKFMRYLASQGFNYDDIKAVLGEEI